MARVNVLGKERVIKESIRNVKRTMVMQKTMLGLEKAMDKEKDEVKMLDMTMKMMDATTQYVADMVNSKDVTINKLEELEFGEATNMATEIINAVLHINADDDEEKETDEKNE